MSERKKGPVEILCDEIGFSFDRRLEQPAVLIAFTRVLVSHIGHIRELSARIAHVTNKTPSDDSAEVLRRVVELLSTQEQDNNIMIEGAAAIHDFIHNVEPPEDGSCNHLIDMLSSCVSAVRFGLESHCCSRHAAEAASHVWEQMYGVSLIDGLTPAWEHDWARRQLQEAILGIAFSVSRKSPAHEPRQ